MTELTQEQLAEIRARDEALFLEGEEGVGFAGRDRRALLHHIDAQAAKLAKVQELRDAIEAFMRSPQKKDDKARAWEFGNCIAYIKNGLDALTQPEQAAPCANCSGSGITPTGDGYSVDACPQCTPEQPGEKAEQCCCENPDPSEGVALVSNCCPIHNANPYACDCFAEPAEHPEAGRDDAIAALVRFCEAKEHHFAVEDRHALSAILAGVKGRPQAQEAEPVGTPANAEAVRLLRKVWHCRTGYGTDVCEMLAEDDYDDLCAEVETFLAQHGGRGDE